MPPSHSSEKESRSDSSYCTLRSVVVYTLRCTSHWSKHISDGCIVVFRRDGALFLVIAV
jgi:hypothetical protein